jgi:hypothetical protein
MEKLIYALWRRPDEPLEPLERRVLDDVAPALLDTGVAGLRVNIEAPEAAAMRWGAAADGSLLFATIGVWLPSIDDRAMVDDVVGRPGVRWAAHLVTESVPLAYKDIDWDLGSRSPGVSIVTLFGKLDGLTDEEFFAVWHGEQTPISFELHPITLYMRNAVWRVLPAKPGEQFRGIVEECVGSLDDLLDFDRFYGAGGDPARLKDNMARSMAVHHRFTDMVTMQMVPCHEYLYRVVST